MSFFKQMDNKSENEKSGSSNPATEKVKCLIIGSGPAGYTAAIYAARANLNPVLYEGLQPGGQLTTTTEVENFPGYPQGVTGPVMMEDLKAQALRFGADIRFGIATSVDFSGHPHKVVIDDEKTIESSVVIIATGATAKYLGLESEEKFKGSGVSACATCDGFFYRGKDVAVVGGGDTAAEEACYLAGLCKKVYLIIRRDEMRASKAMQERVKNTQNIEVLFEHAPKEITGDNMGVTGAILTNKKTGADVQITIDGFFVAIGHHPNSDIFQNYIETDPNGYIKTIPGSSKTNVKGVFACGDVQDPHYRQAITAAGSGCMAALDAERYLGEIG
ncbi:MAG: thioredoxin-disulfide reductase [Bacteroidetes bacterium GWF2_38_335]|nr:MAG: thioredoxin-disulfide reductase [Bacteroidetes bacterium GWF2_38_335]OFY79450.1 MAG: thioredoxin-disulfide reductase [Bacteroidetes bacterium RIFOXYA12_FULL_38_20]HBS86617.1 thioredoxin-disulfide reductase [Bacteroidales bacterium]